MAECCSGKFCQLWGGLLDLPVPLLLLQHSEGFAVVKSALLAFVKQVWACLWVQLSIAFLSNSWMQGVCWEYSLLPSIISRTIIPLPLHPLSNRKASDPGNRVRHSLGLRDTVPDSGQWANRLSPGSLLCWQSRLKSSVTVSFLLLWPHRTVHLLPTQW